ncbi:hypothetical protein [Parasphingopyxis lamellibrachiae]|uniref:Uncharacterized protein n=1 Tax=Parasphingopyxis lamellibrachiae TaxID=680125 RepID=A0A3D9FFY0_9SPHN|nr:hypothetical protein [Parasphingopyxis lamellibrachiae]RED16663.1 hypothetical protein DFR46_1690 [Parasphingopyxis lamellibrachiae]
MNLHKITITGRADRSCDGPKIVTLWPAHQQAPPAGTLADPIAERANRDPETGK